MTPEHKPTGHEVMVYELQRNANMAARDAKLTSPLPYMRVTSPHWDHRFDLCWCIEYQGEWLDTRRR